MTQTRYSPVQRDCQQLVFSCGSFRSRDGVPAAGAVASLSLSMLRTRSVNVLSVGRESLSGMSCLAGEPVRTEEPSALVRNLKRAAADDGRASGNGVDLLNIEGSWRGFRSVRPSWRGRFESRFKAERRAVASGMIFPARLALLAMCVFGRRPICGSKNRHERLPVDDPLARVSCCRPRPDFIPDAHEASLIFERCSGLDAGLKGAYRGIGVIRSRIHDLSVWRARSASGRRLRTQRSRPR